MSSTKTLLPSGDQIVAAVRRFIDAEVGGKKEPTKAEKPGHRTPFKWPPSAISYRFHVLASDWTGRAVYRAYGEDFPVRVAHTDHGYFGRCEKLWHEAKGNTEAEMLAALAQGAEPLLRRQLAIAKTVGADQRYVGFMRDLAPEDLVKLLYCRDRDVANEARVEIEKHAGLSIFGPALVEILCDVRHPFRRSAQWCVLDIFEDLPSVCKTTEEQQAAIEAMKGLLWNAEDDYARTVYKAGVVLGGHLPDELGGPVLMECLQAPSRIGRRSAIHGLYHVVEWQPHMTGRVVESLRDVAASDPEPLLRPYALAMAGDIEAGREHVSEPVFEDENV
jgi:hypothetical protein